MDLVDPRDVLIWRAFRDEAEGAGDAVVQQALAAPEGVPEYVRRTLIARSAYSVGLEIGLSIAVADVAAGRMLLNWISRHVQELDPDALAARDRQAANYLRVLR